MPAPNKADTCNCHIELGFLCCPMGTSARGTVHGSETYTWAQIGKNQKGLFKARVLA